MPGPVTPVAHTFGAPMAARVGCGRPSTGTRSAGPGAGTAAGRGFSSTRSTSGRRDSQSRIAASPFTSSPLTR